MVDSVALFDEPSRWRADAAIALGLRGLELAAAVGAGAAFPSVLRSLAASMRLGATDLLVDLGAGMGGASTWLAHLTGARVVGVEPAAGSRDAAARLFPALPMVEGTADDTPLADGTAAAVTALGVCSLLPDLTGLLDEATRLLGPRGMLGIADLFSVSVCTERAGPNVLRSIDALHTELAGRGFQVEELGLGLPAAHVEWAALQRMVDERVADEHRHDPGFEEWIADQRHLQHLVDDGRVMGGCVLARRTDATGDAGRGTPTSTAATMGR